MTEHLLLISAWLIGSSPVQSSSAGASNWNQFRGPSGSGLSTERKIPSEWDSEKNVLWKTPIPGRGWSQPIVWKDQVLITTAVTTNLFKPSLGPPDFQKSDGTI